MYCVMYIRGCLCVRSSTRSHGYMVNGGSRGYIWQLLQKLHDKNEVTENSDHHQICIALHKNYIKQQKLQKKYLERIFTPNSNNHDCLHFACTIQIAKRKCLQMYLKKQQIYN